MKLNKKNDKPVRQIGMPVAAKQENNASKIDNLIIRDRKMSLSRKIWFDVGRMIDPALQYLILGCGYGYAFWRFVGFPVKHIGVTGVLSPRKTMMLGMSTVAALRQAYWVTFLNNSTDFPPSVIIGVNVVTSTLNSLFLIRNPSWNLSYLDYAAIGLFAFGSFCETVSDIQRKVFIENKRNVGKIQMNGLFSWARHINYGGFVLWRFGQALASGSSWAMVLPLSNVYDFLTRAIPVMDMRMTQKNKEQWEIYKRRTPYKLIPYLY